MFFNRYLKDHIKKASLLFLKHIIDGEEMTDDWISKVSVPNQSRPKSVYHITQRTRRLIKKEIVQKGIVEYIQSLWFCKSWYM